MFNFFSLLALKFPLSFNLYNNIPPSFEHLIILRKKDSLRTAAQTKNLFLFSYLFAKEPKIPLKEFSWQDTHPFILKYILRRGLNRSFLYFSSSSYLPLRSKYLTPQDFKTNLGNLLGQLFRKKAVFRSNCSGDDSNFSRKTDLIKLYFLPGEWQRMISAIGTKINEISEWEVNPNKFTEHVKNRNLIRSCISSQNINILVDYINIVWINQLILNEIRRNMNPEEIRNNYIIEEQLPREPGFNVSETTADEELTYFAWLYDYFFFQQD